MTHDILITPIKGHQRGFNVDYIFSYLGIPDVAKPSWMREPAGIPPYKSEDEAESDTDASEDEAESGPKMFEDGAESDSYVSELREGSGRDKTTQTILEANTQQLTATDDVKYSITFTAGDSALFAKFMATIAEKEESLKALAPRHWRQSADAITR
jgi:hypothetical protein